MPRGRKKDPHKYIRKRPYCAGISTPRVLEFIIENLKKQQEVMIIFPWKYDFEFVRAYKDNIHKRLKGVFPTKDWLMIRTIIKDADDPDTHYVYIQIARKNYD